MEKNFNKKTTKILETSQNVANIALLYIHILLHYSFVITSFKILFQVSECGKKVTNRKYGQLVLKMRSSLVFVTSPVSREFLKILA